VLAQYVFEPYGSVALSETLVDNLATELTNTLGHQGLHFVRLDDTSPAANTLTPTARGLYYNRNRFYSPDLGRFITRDPNATALPILTAMTMNGQVIDVLLSSFDGQALYGDGVNLYLYVGANPVTGRDPLGLSQGDFDDLLGDLTGQRVATLGFIREASGMVLLGMHTTVNIAGGLLGVDLLKAGANILSGEGTLSDWVEVGITAATTATGTILAYKAVKWLRRYKASRRFRKAIERHHLLPREFEKGFSRAGIGNIDDFVIELDRARHRLKPNGIHTNAGGNWNRRWRQFFEDFKARGVNPGRDDIMSYLARLRSEFGI